MNTDQIYIDTLKDQIKSGIYDHLFEGKSDLVFLDIGANIGLVSIYAVPYCKRIVAVEPCKETYDRLKDNTRIYPMIDNGSGSVNSTVGAARVFRERP
jgi:predicted RNA methylase